MPVLSARIAAVSHVATWFRQHVASTRRTLGTLALGATLSAAAGGVLVLDPPAAHAQASPFNYEASVSVVGDEPGWVKIIPVKSIESLTLKVTRKKDGEVFEFNRANLAAGEPVTFEFEPNKGVHNYQLAIRAVTSDGVIEGTSTFEIAATSPMEVGIDFGSADLDGGSLEFEASSPIARAELQVWDEGKGVIDTIEVDYDGKKRRQKITWTPDSTEPVLLELKVYDPNSAWSIIQLFRFEVPHENVVFDTNKATVRDDQAPKLESTKAFIEETIGRFDTVVLELYIAGYTDTVGSNSDNQKLSQKRARSIARWFTKAGLGIPVYYQGFGEEVLAVQTGDNVDNESNRRTVYVLSNSRPGITPQFPRSKWKRAK